MWCWKPHTVGPAEATQWHICTSGKISGPSYYCQCLNLMVVNCSAQKLIDKTIITYYIWLPLTIFHHLLSHYWVWCWGIILTDSTWYESNVEETAWFLEREAYKKIRDGVNVNHCISDWTNVCEKIEQCEKKGLLNRYVEIWKERRIKKLHKAQYNHSFILFTNACIYLYIYSFLPYLFCALHFDSLNMQQHKRWKKRWTDRK